MPLPGLATFFDKRYDVSLITDEEEDVDGPDAPAADEDSSGEDFSGEGYSAGGSPNQSGAEESDDEESDGRERSSSSTEDQHQHISPAASQTNPSHKPSPAITPKKGTGISKGTGPALLSGLSRRPRNFATYNLKTLSRQAVGYSDNSPKKKHNPQKLDIGPRRKSEPPTYNLKELVQRTRGRPSGSQNLTNKVNKVAKRRAKGNASAGGQPSSHIKDWPVSGDSDHDDNPSKRQRLHPGTSIADSFASESPNATDCAIQKINSASISAPQRPLTDSVTSSKLQDSSALLQYITPCVQSGGGVLDPKGIADDERLANMLALPVQRTIEWNIVGRSRWSVNGKIDIVALVMQLTGEEPPSPCNRCTSDPKYGQWMGCKVVSSKMATEAWRLYGCANCVYHGKQTYCSLKSWSRKRGTRDTVSQENPNGKNHDREVKDDSSEDIDQSEASATEMTTMKGENVQSYSSGDPVYRNSDGAAMDTKLTQHQDTSLVSAGRSADTPLMMEPWEKAPGRIRSRTTETIENIAFSKSYLANGHEISVCKQATFRVEIVRSGHTQQFTPKEETIRLCSIASGKLIVRMDGEDPFTIGSHGMFRILPGSACLVENEIYDDVTVHVTSIKLEDD